MKLHRLRVVNFAGIADTEVEFGPGLNVLYGPNDLGKSTLVDAIRLALLLPHGSTYCEQYIAWTGGRDPVVELTFETEPQRILRVKKVFGKGGSSLLQESKDGVDFDDVARARNVDAKLRQVLRWGIAEPGGSGGSKGLPPSFLATALLSTQDDVTAMLRDSLLADPNGSGKERIAAALQAVAQDPLFVTMLRCTQARRDEAYTDRGAKRTGKGSVFKAAAEQLIEARNEKERLQQIVADSQGTEKHLQELMTRRVHRQEALAVATDQHANLERLAAQAADYTAATERVRLAEQEATRIRKMGAEVTAAEHLAATLIEKASGAEQALQVARERQTNAGEALARADETARAEGTDPSLGDTVVRQQLELRSAAADQAVSLARQRIAAANEAQKLVSAAALAEREHGEQQVKAGRARELSLQTAEKEKTAKDSLLRCDLLERALDLQAADRKKADAAADVEKEAALRARLDSLTAERTVLSGQRSEFTVPPPSELPGMRRLAADRAAARAALEVGLVVTVTPNRPLDLRVRKDGTPDDSRSTDQPWQIEADTEVEIELGKVATVSVRGGRRKAQENAVTLEDRWNRDVVPHFARAGVTDLEGLDARVGEARELDSRIKTKDEEMETLRAQIAALTGAAKALREATRRADACRAALGDTPLASLAADLKKLGGDPLAGLRKKRQHASTVVDDARAVVNQAVNDLTVAEERTRNLQTVVNESIQTRNAALAAFPNGIAEALAAGQSALTAGNAEKDKVAAEFASLESMVAARKKRIDAALAGARRDSEEASKALERAQVELTRAKTDHAAENGRLGSLRKLRDAEDLALAEARREEASKSRAALPVPDRNVSPAEVEAAKNKAASIASDLRAIDGEIQRAHGALEQVGGAVARERLRDAVEAFEMAERLEKETEAEYEAWKLLLEQMKEADAAQSSNLGQALAPAVALRFQALTEKRYDAVRLTPNLGTEGVVVAGAVRDTDRMSVGTREQLSTLYRLSLAEYLKSAIVLDDQLVQSDETRMDWFRALLNDKARSFQIVVFTCRPGDYLASTSMVPEGSALHADTEEGLIRAIDLGRALRRPPEKSQSD